MAELTYEIVDVFTDQAFAGNPLAVVFDAGALSTSQLQTLAREFNLSETVFPMRPRSSSADFRVRIFSPVTEMPFAGHPSVGCAVTLARLGRIEAGARTMECEAGLIPVEVLGNQATLSGGPASVGPELSPSPLLSAVGLGLSGRRRGRLRRGSRTRSCRFRLPRCHVRPSTSPRRVRTSSRG